MHCSYVKNSEKVGPAKSDHIYPNFLQSNESLRKHFEEDFCDDVQFCDCCLISKAGWFKEGKLPHEEEV